jgi:PAS domain S-box-containing protein
MNSFFGGRFFRSWPIFPALILALYVAASAQTSLRFRRIAIEDGLSQNTVYDIFQDSRGFMWFATEDGLNRYDGYEFKIYRPDVGDPSGLTTAYITALAEDSQGYLWVGTDGGLNRFNPATETFVRFTERRGKPTGLSGDIVTALVPGEDGVIWIGTSRGLDRYDPSSGAFRHFAAVAGDRTSLSAASITALSRDASGALWVGTEGGGLNRLDPATGTCRRYLETATVRAILPEEGLLWAGTDEGLASLDPATGAASFYRHDPDRASSLGFDKVSALLSDLDGDLWVGTRNGLDTLDVRTGVFTHYRNDLTDSSSLSNDDIRCLRADRSGGLWIGTYAAGLNRLDRISSSFVLMRDRSTTVDRSNRNSIRSILEDGDGTLWIGTDAGLHLVNRRTGVRSDYIHDPRDPGGLGNNVVRAVIKDRQGSIWIGTEGGVDRLDPGKKAFVHFRHDPADPNSLSSDSIRFLLEGRDGSIWMATMGGGLERYDRAARRLVHYRSRRGDPDSLSSDRLYTLCQDRSGALWIGTWGEGLDRLDPDTGKFRHYRTRRGDPRSLSDNNIASLLEARDGTIWVGSRGGYLSRLDPADRAAGRFTRYGAKDGLPNGSIYAILEDEGGNLWISHNLGLSRFDPRTLRTKTFGPADGLQSREFNGSSAFRSPAGEMFFGGINGLNAFFPRRIRDNPLPPGVAITAVQAANRSVPIRSGPRGDKVPEGPRIADPAVRLSYRDKTVTFVFVALHFAAPENNQYAYELEGFDTEWNRVGTRRLATYTNLPPGRFVFRVKAANNDGLWNEEGTALAVVIAPPYWRTFWFKILTALAVLGVTAGALRARILRFRRQKRDLETKVEERTTALTASNRRLEEEVRDRQTAEEALRQEKTYLDLLVESAPEAIVIVDRKHRVTRINSEFSELFGWRDEEVLGQDLDDLLAPESLRPEAKEFTRQLDRGRRLYFESRRLRRDGRLVDVAGIGAPIQVGLEILGYFAIYRDISDRKKSEAAIRKRATQAAFINRVGQRVSSKLEIGPLLHEIVDAVFETFHYYSVHLFLHDEAEGRLKLEAAAGGYSALLPRDLTVDLKSGMVGNAAALGCSLVAPDVRKDAYYVPLVGELTQSELAVPIRSGHKTVGVLDIQSIEKAAFDESDVAAMETLSSQLASAIENARLYEGLQKELDQRSLVERRLQDSTEDLARSNKELEQFAYVASHDLQEPMRMVGSFVQLLSRRYTGRLDPDADEFIHFAVDGATRMQAMINDLLAYSRVGTRGKPFAPTDSGAALERALANLKVAIAEQRAAVTHDVLPVVIADETQLTMLFQNLVANAVKFQPGGKPLVHVSAAPSNEGVIFSVRDNGIGIEARHKDRIFQVFERLHREAEFKGTGIGLAICKRIVERHGGRIWVESSPGHGSTFFFTIPGPPA